MCATYFPRIYLADFHKRLSLHQEMNNILLKMTEALNGVNTRLSIIEDKLERKGE